MTAMETLYNDLGEKSSPKKELNLKEKLQKRRNLRLKSPINEKSKKDKLNQISEFLKNEEENNIYHQLPETILRRQKSDGFLEEENKEKNKKFSEIEQFSNFSNTELRKRPNSDAEQFLDENHMPELNLLKKRQISINNIFEEKEIPENVFLVRRKFTHFHGDC